ncbi:MAG TPA: TIGR03118 family protein [Terracidiphilus sp.]|nr:TIGR03118 family protein [Terracidiphilus sp.]
MLKTRYVLLCLIMTIIRAGAMASSAVAQSTSYRTRPLASNGTGANHQSSTLLNPWGLAFLPGQGFFVAENASGRVDQYDQDGNALDGLTIPAPSGSSAAFSKPTGIVADPEGNFGPPGANFQYLVAADNGTIWGFRVVNGVPQPAQLFADLGVAAGASYTGIAVLHPDCCTPYVAVANFAQGEIITYSGTNTLVSLGLHQFTDPNLPAGYSPYNIQKIGNQVFVTYAQQNASHLPVASPGAGLIDIYDLEGNFVQRLVSPGGALNAPWGIALAASNFGPYGTAIVVGNVGDGTINAFGGGNYLGALKDTSGSPLSFAGLHGLAVRSDNGGDPNALYEVSGSQAGQTSNGAFGAITTSLETFTTLNVPTTAVVGTPVTLTAHTVSAAGIPSGTVTFFDDSVHAIGQQGLDSNGSASITLSTLGAGIHSFIAAYVGNFDSSTSSAISVTITGSTTTTRYHLTPLLSDLPGLPNAPDRLFKNPWGLSFVPAGPFWAAENGSANMNSFDETGAFKSPGDIRVVRSDLSPAKPSAIAANPNASVIGGDFTLPDGTPGGVLVATQDGLIGGWGTINGEIVQLASIVRDDSTSGAEYDGMAIIDPMVTRSYLALADFHNARVQVYDSTFSPLGLPGNFTDPSLPTGYAPFNVQQIGYQVFVTYALQDTAKQNPVPGTGNGIVDVFDLLGHFVSRFASNGVLNEPWGIVQASANFGDYSNDILIANHGDGSINAFDPVTGNYVGTLTDEDGQTLSIFGVWALAFRSDNGTVDPNTLFFTDGENNGADGLFGSITVANSTANTASNVALSFSGDISVTSIFVMNADVTGSSGTPTGAVSYYDGLVPLGSAPVINGRASLINTVFLGAGTHSITARYSGDQTYLVGRVTVPLQIAGLADTVILNAPPSATQGDVVTLTADVSTPQGTPTGAITFKDGGTTLGTAGLDASGVATFAISTLSVGAHSLTASYPGDVIFQAGVSQPVSVTITALAPPPPPPAPTPVIVSLAPFSIKSGTTGSTLTLSGTGFVSNSVVMINTTALSTTYVSSTQLTAVIPATAIMNSGTVAVQVVNPTPGGPSGSVTFPIDTATNTSAAFTQSTLTLTAGQSAAANVQLNGFTGTVLAQCLNAPVGVTCSFSQSTGVLTIQSTANTPKGPFALTVIFSGSTAASAAQQNRIVSASLLALPALLFGGVCFKRNRQRGRPRFWIASFVMLAGVMITAVGCGGGASSMPPSNPPPAVQPAQASAGLTITVQ